MSDVTAWSVTDSSNTSAAPDGWPENMSFANVNNGGRAIQGAVARWHRDASGYVTATGSSNAFVIAPENTYAAYAAGIRVTFKANHTISGAATLQIDALAAKDLRDGRGDALTSGAIEDGQFVTVIYDATNGYFRVLEVLPPSYATNGIEAAWVASPSAPTVQQINVNAGSRTALEMETSWLYGWNRWYGTLTDDATVNGYNAIVTLDAVDGDAVDRIGGLWHAMRVSADTVGPRSSVIADMGITGTPTASSDADLQYVGIESPAYSTANCGGTTGWTGTGDPSTYYKGGLFGGNDHPRLASGATYWYGLYGREVNVEIETGGSAFARVGLFVVTGENAASQAVDFDCAIGISNKFAATIPWGRGISFGATWGTWPFDSTSTLIGAQKRLYPTTSPESTIEAGTGIDFSQVTFSDFAFKSNGFSVDPSGNVVTNTISVVDGVTAPDAVVGQAILYVDSSTGDLMVIFGDGTTKTIVVDT